MVCSLYEEQEDPGALAAADPPAPDNRAGAGADTSPSAGSNSGAAGRWRSEEPTGARRPEATAEAGREEKAPATPKQAPRAGNDPPPEGRASGPIHRIRYADDLKPDEDSIHLPLIQCRECRATGWGCVKHAAEHRVGQDLRVFHNHFFLRDVDVHYLFPLAPDETRPPNVRGRESKVCGRCGYLLAARDGDACPGCGHDRLTRAFRPDSVVSRRRGKAARRELSRDCPFCEAREALIILGARASSLLSTALTQLFASRHNDDHKVIAFSDNVQDAAHRGSFFAARTWRNGIRSAISQAIANHEGIALADLPDRVVEVWSLTWHDLEAVLGAGSDALDVLDGDDGRMAQLQRTLDTRWETGALRERLSAPSLELLVRYLQKPDAKAWKCAVFTRLLGLFEADNMTTADLEREFSDAIATTLPPMLRDAFGALPDATARAGRGRWRNMDPTHTQIFVAIPLAAVEPPDPESMMVALHLDDAAPPESQDYRREWNGVLRLYNLLQFLPNGWWTTTSGVERDLYPELPPPDLDPDPGTETPDRSEWAEAMSLADAGLHSTMEALAAGGIPPPDVGFELAGPGGEVVAEAELAWEAARGAVLLSPEAQRSASCCDSASPPKW